MSGYLRDCGEIKDCRERKCIECEIPALERNNYFCGKLMVERDFWCDQHYHMGKQRRHNKNAHGWGTLCGLKVVQHPIEECRDRYIIIKPGVALDCCGREIVVSEEYRLALPLEDSKKEDFLPVRRPVWTSIYIAVRYRECFTEPVPSLFSECGCDNKCEPNRIKDTYEIKILREEEHKTKPLIYDTEYTSTTLVLDSNSSTVDDIYVDATVKIISGKGAEQRRTITAYDGTGRQATIDSPWDIIPNHTSTYLITKQVHSGLARSADISNIYLANNASAQDDEYNGYSIKILSGRGMGQIRTITDYEGARRQAVVAPDWDIIPGRISSYMIGVNTSGKVQSQIPPDGEPCTEIYRKVIDTCPTCSSESENHWVVLASIRRYRPGVKVNNAKIDNYTHRKLVPSTDLLYKMIQCILDKGPGEAGPPGPPGPEGPEGPAGKNGKDGMGLQTNLPKILDIGWEHGKIYSFDDFKYYLFCENDPYKFIKKLYEDGNKPLLTLYFKEEMKGINRQTFQVEISFPQIFEREIPGARNTYEFIGAYNIFNLRIYGHLIPLSGLRKTPNTNEDSYWAVTFIPYKEFFNRLVPNYLSHAFLGQRFDLDPPVLHILLKGDFVWSGEVFDERNLLDANNIGGQVGPHGRHSGNMVQGGYFESWLFLNAPKNMEDHRTPLEPETVERNIMGVWAGKHEPGININKASVEELRRINGVDDDLARKIVDYRRRSPFTTVSEIVNVPGIGQQLLEKNRGLLTLRDDL